MDGKSLVHQIVQPIESDELPQSVAAHLQRHAEQKVQLQGKKSALPANGAYIEYHGLGMVADGHGRLGDAWNNTYRALRVIDHQPGGLGNVLYAEFGDFFFESIDFFEFYDLDADQWQQHNSWYNLSEANKSMWAKRIQAVFGERHSPQ
jgi:hypothetical protein